MAQPNSIPPKNVPPKAVLPKRVLLAEDEPNIIESLKFLLDRAGFDVIVAVDGQQAIDAANATKPDVVILDVMLPKLDGYEVLRLLRQNQTSNTPTSKTPTSKTPRVLMLTAKGQREDRETALENGADLFMTKPYENNDIIAAVKQLAGLTV